MRSLLAEQSVKEPKHGTQLAGSLRGQGADLHLLGVLVIAAVVVIVRSLLIRAAHSETVDAEYHVNRGLAFLTGTLGRRALNEPLLGQAISAVPLWLSGCFPTAAVRGIYGYWMRPTTVLALIAIWKSLLFVPLVGVVFWWCRRIYGVGSAWLAAVMILVEPTFAAYVGLPSVEVLGAEGIVIACFLIWRYFEKPAVGRLNAACLAVAVALLVSHTALLLPLIAGIYALQWWVVRPWWISRGGAIKAQATTELLWRARLGAMVRAVVLVPLIIWALMLFDFSAPAEHIYHPPPLEDQPVAVEPPVLLARWPAGTYVGSLVQTWRHSADWQTNYLQGRIYGGACWYYFAVVASYKMPVGIGLVMGLGLLSLFWVRPRWEEWALLVPMVAYLAWMMSWRITVSFGQVLPVYGFMLMLAARCAAEGSTRWARLVRLAAWAGVALAGWHGLKFHPDYLSYINLPRKNYYLRINDRNLDAGQSLKQVRTWVRRFQRHDKRQVYLCYFGSEHDNIRYYLGDLAAGRLKVLSPRQRPGLRGVLIISPVRVAGIYDPQDRYAALRKYRPAGLIGHCLLVYDLDQLRGRYGFKWSMPKPAAPSRQAYEE